MKDVALLGLVAFAISWMVIAGWIVMAGMDAQERKECLDAIKQKEELGMVVNQPAWLEEQCAAHGFAL